MSNQATQEAPSHAQAVQPSASRRKHSNWWIALWLLLAGLVTAVTLGVILVLAGDGSTVTSTEPGEVAGSTGGEVTTTSTGDADVVVRAFARAWQQGNWAEITARSSESITTIARDWYVVDHRIEVVDPVTDSGAELLVTDPQGGSALIFNVGLDTASGSPVIVGLEFGGDAGGSGETTQPAQAELTVTEPQPGDVFPSGSTISGLTTSETIEYRLVAGGTTLASGIVATDDGAFTTAVSFTNTCCVEMTLEITQPGVGFTTIALSHAEPD